MHGALFGLDGTSISGFGRRTVALAGKLTP
jgi:hypothetical protein